MKQYNVAILGATGAVGQEMMKILAERDFPVAQLHGPLFEIDLIQQQPVFHMVLRMRHDTLPFHLELADGNGLVHLRCQ